MTESVTVADELAVEAFGVRLGLGASDPQLLPRLHGLVPPGAKPCPVTSVGERFALVTEDGVGYRILGGGAVELRCADLELAVGLLDALVRSHIAFHAPDRVFVHAGVVSHRGRAIVLPGPTFSGKTTLVGALLRAGAVYYSEEYAVLDEQGLVHPYRKPLSIRGPDFIAVDRPVETVGESAVDEPAPVGLIALTRYRPGARWHPRRTTAGQGLLGLIANTFAVRDRPAQALAATRGAVAGALVLEGERGEADETAAALLQLAGETATG